MAGCIQKPTAYLSIGLGFDLLLAGGVELRGRSLPAEMNDSLLKRWIWYINIEIYEYIVIAAITTHDRRTDRHHLDYDLIIILSSV